MAAIRTVDQHPLIKESAVASKCLVLLSGGLKSAALTALAAETYESTYCLTFRPHWLATERKVTAAGKIARLFGQPHKTIGLDFLFDLEMKPDRAARVKAQWKDEAHFESVRVPAGHQVMLSIASNIAICLGISDILTGVGAEDHSPYPDANGPALKKITEAIKKGNESLKLARQSLSVSNPMISLTNAEIIAMAKTTHKGWQALALSHSCTRADVPCGDCWPCRDRAAAFRASGDLDPATAL